MSQLPPVPAGVVILAGAIALVVWVTIHLIKRRLASFKAAMRREMGRQLRQAFVTGFATGMATGFVGGRKVLPGRPRCYPQMRPAA